MSILFLFLTIMATLGDRMKKLEAKYEMRILPTVPFILRLDGKNFSTFTRGFKRPFDYNFVIAMVKTMNDLLVKYNATTGYTHSDEISLIFPAACTKEEYDVDPEKVKHMYDGRVIKICTVVAGYCSTRFSYHIANIIGEVKGEYKDKFVDKIFNCETCFDCRILSFDDNMDDIVNHMIWRSRRDCYRNCVSTYAQHHFNSKQIHGCNGNVMIKMLKEKDICWETDVPSFLKYGIYAKKNLFEKECVNVKTGEKVLAIRTGVNNFNFEIYYDVNILEILLAKYMPDTFDKYSVPFYKINIEQHNILTEGL